MNKIRVGIDCDSVLRDFIGKTVELCREEGVYIDRPTNWDYVDNVKVGENTIREMIWGTDQWLSPVFEGADELPFAKKGYDAFIDDPMFEVYIVTSQTNETEYLTANWLRSHGYDKHEKTYYLFDKLKAPVQILIDDKPSHIKDFNDNGREGYLVTSSHNMDCDLKPRVDNLYEAYKQITERYKKEVV